MHFNLFQEDDDYEHFLKEEVRRAYFKNVISLHEAMK